MYFSDGSGASFTIGAGAIIGGGDGGAGAVDASDGIGGAGIVGSDLTVINSGTIAGGMGGDGTTRANAITFTSGANRLELRGGYSFTGNVVVQSGATGALALGGDTDSDFDVGQIGGSAQYRGFDAFEKTGDSVWTLMGTTSAMTPWTISQGTLSVSSDASLGHENGALTFNGGTLATTESFASNREMVLNSNGRFDVSENTALLLAGNITGTGGLTKLGEGTLTLSGANTYESGTTVRAGTLVVDGGSITHPSAFGNNVTVGQAADDVATLRIENGGTVSNQNGYIGEAPNSEGRVSVTGPDSSWNSSAIFIGEEGTGVLTIEEDGAVESVVGYIGLFPEAEGAVTVTEGANWTSNDILYVGFLGTGTLNIADGGTVTSGNSVIGEASIRAGSSRGAVEVIGSGSSWTVTDDANLTVGNLSFATGALTIANKGEVTVTGNVIIADQANSEGVLTIGAGYDDDNGQWHDPVAAGVLNASTVEFREGDGRLVFNHTDDDYTFDSALVSAGGGDHAIEHLSGTTLLTGDSSGFAGTTTVSGGALLVGDAAGNGVLGGSLTIADGGMLGGSGTVGSGAGSTVTLGQGGTLSPGNSIGTLTVDGDLTLASGAVYRVELNDGGAGAGVNSDHLHVTGMATLADGAVVHLTPENGRDDGATYRADTAYSLLTADGGLVLEGGLALDNDFAYLDFAFAQDANGLTALSRLAEQPGQPEEPDLPGQPIDSFCLAGMSRNQCGTGDAAFTLGEGHAVYDRVLGLSEAQAEQALNQLSGEVHASVVTGLVEDSRFVRNAANDRVRAAFGGTGAAVPAFAYGPDGAPTPVATDHAGPVFWSHGFGAWGETDGDGNAASVDRSSSGLLIGTDRSVGDWRVGVLAGYSRSSVDLDGRASSADVDSYHLGLYGGTQWAMEGGTLSLRGGLAHTWHDIETSRFIGVSGFSDSLSADYRANTFQAFGELGYGIETDVARVEPFVNLAHVHTRTGSFGESGGAAALSSASGSMDTTFATPGIRAETDLDLGLGEGEETGARLYGTVGWRHAFGDVTPESTHAFAGSDAFTIAGSPIGRNALVLDTGLELDLTPNSTLGVSYQGQFASGMEDHGVSATLSIRF
ncbi:autotransporter domain-containing protein [Halomonas sp. MCCC 1A11036]|uniref:Autotransporter domain-containing protein n=1 Tax=Billgrantia zhangzhouensis TaxID=2733481 RepID=A0ABS9AFD9_9GAMM|nr:autotransporter domain-containing protein [Halomonas zhangzhouensis]MCE8020457.1 autotransporter domain-containing protein [Halomonas zhangzhouensis]